VVFWTVVPSPSWPYSLLPQAQRASGRGAGVGVGGSRSYLRTKTSVSPAEVWTGSVPDVFPTITTFPSEPRAPRRGTSTPSDPYCLVHTSFPEASYSRSNP